jgi:hypothetical protein
MRFEPHSGCAGLQRMGLATINGLHDSFRRRFAAFGSRYKLHPVLNLMQSNATATAVGAVPPPGNIELPGGAGSFALGSILGGLLLALSEPEEG